MDVCDIWVLLDPSPGYDAIYMGFLTEILGTQKLIRTTLRPKDNMAEVTLGPS